MKRRPRLGKRQRLLPGEDLNTTDLEDAKHWRRVYAELAELTDRLAASAEAAREAPNARRVLAAEAERMRSRRDYWASRHGALTRLASGPVPHRRPLPAV